MLQAHLVHWVNHSRLTRVWALWVEWSLRWTTERSAVCHLILSLNWCDPAYYPISGQYFDADTQGCPWRICCDTLDMQHRSRSEISQSYTRYDRVIMIWTVRDSAYESHRFATRAKRIVNDLHPKVVISRLRYGFGRPLLTILDPTQFYQIDIDASCNYIMLLLSSLTLCV